MFLTFKTVVGCSKETESLVQIIFVVTALVLPSELNTAPVEVANHTSRSCNAAVFRGNICLETSSFIDSKFPTFVNRCTEALVVLSSVNVVGVIFGVVDMFLGAVIFLLARCISSSFKTHTDSSRVSLW